MDRSGRLAVLTEPKIISLVFDVFICMLLLVGQDRTESKICGISLVKHDEGTGYQFRQRIYVIRRELAGRRS